MTTFNTGNPLGSVDPRDLYDNAENLEILVNGEVVNHYDRLGVLRLTWHGIEEYFAASQADMASEYASDKAERDSEFEDDQARREDAFQQLLTEQGYQELGDYEAGLEFTQLNQVVEVDGYLYRIASTATLPYTTSGDWEADRSNFVQVSFVTADRLYHERTLWQSGDANLQAQISGGEPLEASAFSPVSWHDQVIENSVTIPDAKNAWSFGPEMTIAEGQAVTVGEGSHWTISAKQVSLEGLDSRVTDIELQMLSPEAIGVPSFSSISEGLNRTDSGDRFIVLNDGDYFMSLYLNNQNIAEPVSHSATFYNLPNSEDSAGEGEPYLINEQVHVARTLNNYYKFNWGNYVSTHAEQYALFDGLMNEFPQYISRRLLGQDDYGNNIYAYSLAPPDMFVDNWSADQVAPPQVILVGGLHGHEKNSQLANFVLADELCRRWQSFKRLDELRWCCEIIIVPCANPSGIDDHTRKNRNGVDLGRNFPVFWSSGGSDDPTSNFYRGPSAASEPETQAIMTLADIYPNAVAAIDHHNSAGLSSQGFGPWIGTRNEEDLPLALKVLRESELWARREMPEIEDFTGTFSRVSSATNGGLAAWFSLEAGIPGYLLENPQAGGLGGQFYQRKFGFELTSSMVYNIYQKAILKGLNA